MIADGGSITRSDIGVVVVTFGPTGDVESRLNRMRLQGGALVVVDNTTVSSERTFLQEICSRRGWELIANTDNLGLGAALNQGVKRVAEEGFTWVLLFDQDSEPASDMSACMLETLRGHPLQDRVSIVGVGFREPNTGKRHRVLRPHPFCPLFFQKAQIQSKDLHSVSMAITSGSLLRIADYVTLGPFDEEFFIDYIDTDFCLRCRQYGHLITISAGANLDHQLGDRQPRRWLGISIFPTNHSALRHYYIARNRVLMWKRHALRFPHWWLFDITFCILNTVRVLLVEDQRRRKFSAIFLGTYHGLLGRKGRWTKPKSEF